MRDSWTNRHFRNTEHCGVETMSHTQSLGRTPAGAPPRVRDQARESLTLMAFSAFTATSLALALLLLTHLGRQG